MTRTDGTVVDDLKRTTAAFTRAKLLYQLVNEAEKEPDYTVFKTRLRELSEKAHAETEL